MAVCLECKADYLPHVTTCPACGRPLDAAPPGEPPPADFVTILEGWPGTIATAQATLEASGIVTHLLDEHSWNVTGIPRVALQVPADDAEAARRILAGGKPP